MRTESDFVFVSYSRRDKEIADRLEAELSARGFNVWRDVTAISPGEDWAHAIEQAFRDAAAFIFLISANSAKSEWVQRELLESLATRDRPIIPVLIDSADEAYVPRDLASRQWVDLSQGFIEAIENIARVLHGSVSTTEPQQPAPQKNRGYAFISYVEEDADFVEGLKEFLAGRGYAFWDFDESERNYHVQLFLELEGLIREAAATLSVLSDDWKRSDWTTKEYIFSEEVGTPVFLLRAKPMEPTLLVAGVPYIDFVSDPSKGFKRLDLELQRKALAG